MSDFRVFLGPAGRPGFTKGGTLEGVSDVADIGLQAMEVEFVYGVRMGMELAEKVGKRAQDRGIRLSVHAPYYINLCSDDEKKYEASKKRIARSVERAERMGADVVVFHPGFYGDLERQEAFDRVVKACKEMAKETPSSVKLGLESTGKKASFGSVDEVVRVCHEVKACTPVIDFAHVFARNVGKIDYKEVLDKVEVLDIDVLHTHFSNVEYTDRGEQKHLIVEDQPPFKPLAEEIVDREISITIISESPILEQDSLRMKKVLEDLGYKF